MVGREPIKLGMGLPKGSCPTAGRVSRRRNPPSRHRGRSAADYVALLRLMLASHRRDQDRVGRRRLANKVD